MRQSRSFR